MDNKQEIRTTKPSIEEITSLYVDSLDDKARKTLEIAKDHLGTSFSLKKSIDFLKWKEEYEKSTSQAN